jgi:hypothetical protein
MSRLPGCSSRKIAKWILLYKKTIADMTLAVVDALEAE